MATRLRRTKAAEPVLRARRRPGLAFVLTAFAAAAAACGPRAPEPVSIAFPVEWPGDPGFAPDADIDVQGIVEPSGICFHPGRGTLFVVSDNGGVYEIRTDGTPVASHPLAGDLEAITVDPSTGLLYIAVEGVDLILEFDPASGGLARRFPLERAFAGDAEYIRRETGGYDNGLEALVFVPRPDHPEGGTFFAGNQDDPACIVELSLSLKSGGEGMARIVRRLPCMIVDPSALVHDPRTGLLGILSDAANTYTEVTLDGRPVRAYAFPGDTQEGLAFDDRGFLYIAQDVGGILRLKDLRAPARPR